jgi:hypothetical protein
VNTDEDVNAALEFAESKKGIKFFVIYAKPRLLNSNNSNSNLAGGKNENNGGPCTQSQSIGSAGVINMSQGFDNHAKSVILPLKTGNDRLPVPQTTKESRPSNPHTDVNSNSGSQGENLLNKEKLVISREIVSENNSRPASQFKKHVVNVSSEGKI